jgi:hypothetical protein
LRSTQPRRTSHPRAVERRASACDFETAAERSAPKAASPSSRWPSPGTCNGATSRFRAGTTSGRFDLVAATGAAPETPPFDKTEPPGTVRLEGQIGLGDLSVSEAGGDDFALGWDDLTVEISELRLPGLLAESNGASRLPAQLRLGSVVMTKPTVRLTRMESGLVLPSLPPEDGSARESDGQTDKSGKADAAVELRAKAQVR